MPRRIYQAKFVRQTAEARLFAVPETGVEMWLPKSITEYYSNDGAGNVEFSVESWKIKELEAAGFCEKD